MAAGLSVDLDGWRREFDELMLRVGGRFARVEPRRRMAAFVRGLLAGLPRVNCWTVAEHAGEQCPRGMQRLLSAAGWDEAGMRDDLPQSWTSDPARCQAAGVPEDMAFATKPALAKEMIGRALDAGAPAAWVAADEVYGQDPQLRAKLARRGLGYVLAVAKSHTVVT